MDDAEQIGVPGELMKAFLVAYDAFLKETEIPKEKRKIENYNIGLSQKGEYYSVFLVPKLKPGEPLRPGGSTELGKAVTFKIKKENYHIIERFFYK